MSKLIMRHNRFSENENEVGEVHLPRHRDSKTKKTRHRDCKTKKTRYQYLETKTHGIKKQRQIKFILKVGTSSNER